MVEVLSIKGRTCILETEGGYVAVYRGYAIGPMYQDVGYAEAEIKNREELNRDKRYLSSLYHEKPTEEMRELAEYVDNSYGEGGVRGY